MTDVPHDPDTGEVLETDDAPEMRDDDVGDDARADRILAKVNLPGQRYRGAVLTREQMADLMKNNPGEPCGVMGFAAKIGAVLKDGQVKRRGMRLSGQILSVLHVPGKFGAQQAVIVQGVYSCPQHKNASGAVVPAVNNAEGRRILTIDATLIDLPSRIGDVIDIEIAKRGGAGQRHTYATVKAWSVDSYEPNQEAPAQN